MFGAYFTHTRKNHLWMLARGFQFLGVAAATHGFTRWATICQIVRSQGASEEETRTIAAGAYMIVAVLSGLAILWSGLYMESWTKRQLQVLGTAEPDTRSNRRERF